MNFATSAITLLLAAAPVAAQVNGNCGTSGFKIAGSSTVFPVAEQLVNVYAAACKQTITVEGGGSSVGAGRVCANAARGTPVEIGNMSREWTLGREVSTLDNWNYKCIAGDNTRNVIQVPVALDGLTVVVKQTGVATTCVGLMGGMTVDQLRWVYSSYTVAKLTSTGWSASALSAGNTAISTDERQWCRLDKRCTCSEINISGADDLSGTYAYFEEAILTDFANGETFQENRLKGYFNSALDEDVAAYVENDGAAIGYFGYAYYAADINRLNAVPVQNRAGEFTTPSPETVANGDYNPLARKIYMNLLKSALARTRPLLEFLYSTQGTNIVKGTGYVALPEAEQVRSLSRLASSRGIDLTKITCGDNKAFTVAGVDDSLIAAMNVWSYHYQDKCFKTTPRIRSAGLAAAYRRVCGFTTSTTGANVGAVIDVAISTDAAVPTTYGTAAGTGKYTCKGTSPVVGLTQLEMIPNKYAYANNAAAVLSITRSFLRFGLSAEGAKLVTAIGGTPLAQATRTTMLARIPAPSGGFGCFAGESTVEVMNQGSVAMKDLSIGDMVKVAGGKFSEVYSFGHYEQGVDTKYVAVDAGLEKTLYITPEHLVFVENKAVPASMLTVGDKLTLVNGEATIKKIKNVVRSGAFAPFTKDGTVVVDGVVASSFVSLQADSSAVKIGGVDTFSWHAAASVFQAPHRVYCELFGCTSESYTNGLSIWIAGPLKASQWLMGQNAVVMTVVLIPAALFVLLASAVETVSPVLLLAAVVAVLSMRKTIKKSA